MAEEDGKQKLHSAVLDLTPEEFERYKWQVEREAHERELILKEREDRRSFFKSPLILSIVGAIVAFLANIANDAYTKTRHLQEAAREAESSLILKAMDQDDPMRIVAKLRLLDAAGMIPGHRNQLMALWTNENAAELLLSAAAPPADGKSAAAGPEQPCETASVAANGGGGWLYLGRAGKTAWIPSEKGSNLIRYEKPPPHGAGYLEKMKGLCLHVAKTKFLHDDGPPGEKLKAPVKMPVSPAMRLRIVELDDGAPDSKEEHKPVWARVEVLAN
ncbi:hypothetical protein SAMN02745126_00029 [Enhydrobacter aerosaccus]|uniref:Uncharacterized protein n=1 Tax=Enhydrobacter aerosaccus TaxID=225324 RepID=A0A1T4JJZ4_9HYPH|nr:hypothetical protein [Enhydrobacter aerosaccus]SJZ30500.1 hypothetical protein SAMN02745126_00029 [Enhydrobacter aerosaccus]